MNPTQDFSELVNELMNTHNSVIDQFNDALTDIDTANDNIDALTIKNLALIEQVNNQAQDIADYKQELAKANGLLDAATKVMNKAKQADTELGRVNLLLTQAKEEIKEFKALNPQRLAKQNKEQKKSLITKQETITSHKASVTKYREAASSAERQLKQTQIDLQMAKVTGIYAKDGHSVVIWPYMEKHKMLNDETGEVTELNQLPLLYMNAKGKGTLMMLDPDNEISMRSSREINPPESVVEFAKAWLNQARRQKWVIDANMLKMVS